MLQQQIDIDMSLAEILA